MTAVAAAAPTPNYSSMFKPTTGASKMTDDDDDDDKKKTQSSSPIVPLPPQSKLVYSTHTAVANTSILTRDCPHEFYIGTFDFMSIKMHWVLNCDDQRGYQSLLFIAKGTRLNDISMGQQHGRVDLSMFNSSASPLERTALGATAGTVQAIYDYVLSGTATCLETSQTVHEYAELDSKDPSVIVMGKRSRYIPHYRFVVRGTGDAKQSPIANLLLQLPTPISSPMSFANPIPYKKEQQQSVVEPLIQQFRKNAGVVGGVTAIMFHVLKPKK